MGASKAKHILPLLVALAVATAVAVPIAQVTVRQLGVGVADVLSPVGEAQIDYVFQEENSQLKLVAVKVKFDRDLPKGAYVRIELRDGSGDTLAVGEVTLPHRLEANKWLDISISPALDDSQMSRYQRAVVVVVGAEVST